MRKMQYLKNLENKIRKSIGYLDNVMPSRKSVANMVENFSLLSFADDGRNNTEPTSRE